MVFVAISTSTPISDQRRRSACVSAAYWSCRIGMDRGAQAHGSGRPAERTISTRLFPREVRLAAPGVVAEDARAGSRPWPGSANRPSAPQTKSCVRATPASASRSAGVRARRARAGERRRSTRSSWASRRARRGSGARAGASRGPGAAGRGRRRSGPSAGPRRSRRAPARRGTRCGRAAVRETSSTAGCARGRAASACASAMRKGPVPIGPALAPAAAIAVRPSVSSDGRIGTGCERRMRTSSSEAASIPETAEPSRRESPSHPRRR